MGVNEITSLISTVGFPIVCCIALFWRMMKADDQHKQEMDKLSEALNNNTIALTKISTLLGGVLGNDSDS